MASQAHLPGIAPPACPPTAPSLLLPAFPGAALLVTSGDAPGSKLIIKLKREGPTVGGGEEMPRTQTFFLTGLPLGWAAPRSDGPLGPGVRTVLVTKALEDLGGRKPKVPEVTPPARAPPPSDASFACTSKGVYENYRRWQRYKALARRHFPATPDAEALACFFIPVLRSLARLRPDMTLEDGVPRAVQEWEHSSNFERMIFYEMAEKFMEFEVEEEQQIQKMKLLASCSQFQAPVPKPTKPTPPPATESSQQQVYIPKKAASKSRQPRRRQRRSPNVPTPGAPREIPAEAVHQYAEIMEGLETSWEEEEDEKKEQRGGGDPRVQEDGTFSDPGLLQYIDQLCGDEEFVCKVEAIIHPQFMADLLSVEKSQDPMDLADELEEEFNLTPNQLLEKRLLVLTEEERERTFCPTSHSDSTPFQSEDEDEVSNSGKGEETSCKAMKRPSPSQGLRAGQLELSAPGKRDFPSKAARLALSLSPHKCGSCDSQEGRMLPVLKNADERETQNLQKHDQVWLNLGLAKGMPPHAQREKTSPSVTESNSLTGNPSSQVNMVGQGIQRPHSTECGRTDGKQGKVRGQEEVRRAPEQDGLAESKEETQLVGQNLEPAHTTCGKQDDVQQGEVKREMGIQDNKMLLGDHTSGKRALQQNPNIYEEQRFEKVTGQSQGRGITEPEDTSSRTDLDHELSEGMNSPRDSQMNQLGDQLVQLECPKQNGCQQEALKGHASLPASRKGSTAALNAAAPHCGNTVSCAQSLAGQEHQMSVPAGPGKQLDAPEAKIKSQKKPQVCWEKTKCAPLKGRSSSGKALRLNADSLALPTSTGQDGHQASCPSTLETDQKVNNSVFTPTVEFSGDKGSPLASADSTRLRILEGQLPRISNEHLPSSSSSGVKSGPLSIQTDPGNTGTFQEVQCSISDQGEVTPWVGNQPDLWQTQNTTLNSSDSPVAAEADGCNFGPSGDRTHLLSSSSKTATALSPQLSSHNEIDKLNQKSECGNLLSFKDQNKEASSGSEMITPGQEVGRQDLPEPATETSAALLELSGGKVASGHPYGVQEQAEEEDEDEELSSFSSLLASKLSLSSHYYHVPCPKETEDTLPSSLTKSGKPGSKAMHSVQVPQHAIVLLNKMLGAHATVHRSHKRKGCSSGVRRSKRLRDQ